MSLTTRWPLGEALALVGRLKPWREVERQAMGVLLCSIPWQVYCTWTFRDPVSPERAEKQICSWIHTVAFGFGRNLGWMIGLEHDVGADWCHAHGLLVALREEGKDALDDRVEVGQVEVPYIWPYWQSWFRRHGSGRFELIRERKDTAFYCAKYSAKRGEVIFSSGLERFRGEAPPARITVFPEQQSLGGKGGAFTDPRPPLGVDPSINRCGVVHEECHGNSERGGGRG